MPSIAELLGKVEPDTKKVEITTSDAKHGRRYLHSNGEDKNIKVDLRKDLSEN